MSAITKALWISVALMLGACASTPEDDSTDTSQTPMTEQDDGMSTSGVEDDRFGQATPLEQERAREAALRRQLTIYFDYDSSQIADEFLPVLDAHARFLRDNPTMRLRLEGHTDERGTREYNIALGERRGESVRRALLLRGATRAQLLVVSYGEEQPAVLGSGEAAWGKNRRVELKYQ